MDRPTTSQRGWVYIFRNPAHKQNIFKIGYTSRTIEERLKELETSGSPLPFEAILQVSVSNPSILESRLHELLAEHRVNTAREFFELEQKQLISRVREYIDEHRDEFVPTDFWAADEGDLSEDLWWDLTCPDCNKTISIEVDLITVDLFNSKMMRLCYVGEEEFFTSCLNWGVLEKHFIHVCEDYFKKPQAFHPLQDEYLQMKRGKKPRNILGIENDELYFFDIENEKRLDEVYYPPLQPMEGIAHEEKLDADKLWKLKRRFPYSFFVSGDLPYFTVQRDGYYYCDNSQKEVAIEDSNYRKEEMPYAFEWRLPIEFFKNQQRYPIEIPWELYSNDQWLRRYSNISYRDLRGLDERKPYSVIYDMFSFKFLE